MKISSLFIITIVMSSTIVLSACGGSNKTSVSEALPPSAKALNNSSKQDSSLSKEQKAQKQQEMRVSLATIDGWNNVEGSTALIQYIKDGNSVIVTRDTMPSEAKTPETFIQYVKERFGKVLDNTTFNDISEIGISDPEKHFLVYTHDIKAGGATYQMKGWVTYIFHEGNAYTLTCGALSNSFSEVENDFREFIRSFKLVSK
ncbi:MAG: hypothetical protein AB7G87_10675 [Clostridia bacterium]